MSNNIHGKEIVFYTRSSKTRWRGVFSSSTRPRAMFALTASTGPVCYLGLKNVTIFTFPPNSLAATRGNFKRRNVHISFGEPFLC